MKTPLKVGLAGFMTKNFPGEKEKRYREYIAKLQRYAAGLNFELAPVERGIYNADDARAACRELSASGVHFVLLHAASFSDAALIKRFLDLDDTFLGIWAAPEDGYNSGLLQYNALCFSNLAASSIRHFWSGYRKPVKWFYGDPDSPLFMGRFEVTVSALTAYYALKDSSIAFIGGRAPGFDNLLVDERELHRKLGVSLSHHEFAELHRLASAVPENEVAAITREIRETASSIEEGMEESLSKQARIVAAVRRLTGEAGCRAAALSCWPCFQAEMDCAACTAVGHLNETGLPVACEGDLLSSAAMLALKSLSDEPVTLMDMVDLNEKEQGILLWHCGPTAPSLAGDEGVRMGTLHMLKRGLANDLTLKTGPVTVMGYTPRLDGMLVLQGEIDGEKQAPRGSGGWLEAIEICDEPAAVRDVMETVFSSGYIHHYPLAYGRFNKACLELAAWQGISPIRPRIYKDYLPAPGL